MPSSTSAEQRQQQQKRRIRFRYCCDDIKKWVTEFDSDNEMSKRGPSGTLHTKRTMSDSGTAAADDDSCLSQKSDGAPDTKRKAQNRAAQRAFRERREQLVGNLEERIKELERQQQMNAKDETLLVEENAHLLREIKRLEEENKSLKRVRIGRTSHYNDDDGDDHGQCKTNGPSSCPSGKCNRKKPCFKKRDDGGGGGGSPREPAALDPLSLQPTITTLHPISLFDDLFYTLDGTDMQQQQQQAEDMLPLFIDPVLMSDAQPPPAPSMCQPHAPHENDASTHPQDTILDQWLADMDAPTSAAPTTSTSSTTKEPPPFLDAFCTEFEALALLADLGGDSALASQTSSSH